MRLTPTTLWLAILQFSSFGYVSAKYTALRPRDYTSRDYYALHLAPEISPTEIARKWNLEYEGVLGELDDHHLFSAPLGNQDVVSERIEMYRRRKRNKRDQEDWGLLGRDIDDAILFAQKQKLKKLEKRTLPLKRQADPAFAKEDTRVAVEVAKSLQILDPIFLEQWHLYNSRQIGHDINVTGVWMEGITGYNSTVAIVDDGLDMDSMDLKENYFAAGSYDFNDPGPDPKPRLSDDRHGTRCAGEIAAVKNDVCGVGVAWDSKVAGIRILSKQISDADEAIALNYAYQENQIYSCSWGPPDDGQSMDAPGVLIKRSMVKGVQSGRQGKGSVFVFASGNGAANEDNCNFDGYTNSIYSITVGAIDRMGKHPYYSELCSAQMVVTYSSGSGDAIHTTDVGTNECYSAHGGTSAAAPLAAGIFALVLSVRPELTWRDLQYLALQTAVIVNEDDPDWEETASGKKFNHKYGYGKLDAWAIVQAAKTFELVKPQAWYNSPVLQVQTAIPQGQKGLKSHIEVTKKDLESANLGRLEHVTVTVNANHGKRGDLSMDLISPRGVVSHIATSRQYDKSKLGYDNWTFMSVKHWAEEGAGTWTVIIKDAGNDQFNGIFVDWSITLWGEAIDAENAKPLPLPGDNPNKPDLGTSPDHTSAAPVATTDLPAEPSGGTKVTGNPSDHITRPVNSKPTGSSGDQSATSVVTSVPTGSGDGSTNEGEDKQSENNKSSYLPSFLPTFGVSAKAQAWIYGAIAGIVIFVSIVVAYLLVQKRKQKADQQGMDYEFEVLDDQDDLEGGASGGNRARGGGAGVGGRRKARDLYDAFGASDDEEDPFSDDDEKEYDPERDYEDEEAHGIDEGPREGDREKLLGRVDRQ